MSSVSPIDVSTYFLEIKQNIGGRLKRIHTIQLTPSQVSALCTPQFENSLKIPTLYIGPKTDNKTRYIRALDPGAKIDIEGQTITLDAKLIGMTVHKIPLVIRSFVKPFPFLAQWIVGDKNRKGNVLEIHMGHKKYFLTLTQCLVLEGRRIVVKEANSRNYRKFFENAVVKAGS